MQAKKRRSKKKIHAFPLNWMDDFGSGYYERMVEEKKKEELTNWDTGNSGIPYQDTDLNMTKKEDIERLLQTMMNKEEKEDE